MRVKSNWGFTYLETLIASGIFLGFFVLFLNYHGTLIKSQHRLLFATTVEQLDISLLKLRDALESSTSAGVWVLTPSEENSRIAIQRVVNVDGAGDPIWETKLWVYWLDPSAQTLKLSEISKERASALGLELSTEHPVEMEDEDLKKLVQHLQSEKKTKILAHGVSQFLVDGEWESGEEPLRTKTKAFNAQMPEQSIQMEMKVRLADS